MFLGLFFFFPLLNSSLDGFYCTKNELTKQVFHDVINLCSGLTSSKQTGLVSF